MSRSLAEIERGADLRRRHAEAIRKLDAGGLTGVEQESEVERIQAINAELAAIAAKDAPPEPEPVPGVASLSPKEAAAKAAAIRANAQFWDPRKPDKDGKPLSSAAHADLVREHSALLERAATETTP